MNVITSIKSSPYAISSILISILLISISIFLLFGLYVFTLNSSEDNHLGLAMLFISVIDLIVKLTLLGSFVGIVMGIVGFTKNESKRLYATAGLTMNCVLLLISIVAFIMATD